MSFAININSVNDFLITHKLKHLKIDDVNWEYIKSGKGAKCILILPGGLQDATSCFDLICSMEKEFTVIVPTIKGISTIEEFINSINRILENEGINQVIIYGLSLGGLLSQSYLRSNKEKVKAVVISHAAAPTSKTYIKKVAKPEKFILPIIKILPFPIIKYVILRLSGRVQIGSEESNLAYSKLDPKFKQLRKEFGKDFYKNRLTKSLILSTLKLNKEFYLKEKYTPDDLNDWDGKILILRTDNDPLMQDDGEFKKLYPKANVYTFYDTGHISTFVKFEEFIKVFKKFLKTI